MPRPAVSEFKSEESEKAAALKASKSGCTTLEAENVAQDKEAQARAAAQRQAEEQVRLEAAKRESESLDCLNPKNGTKADDSHSGKCGPSPDVAKILTASRGHGPWNVAEQLLGPEVSAVEILKLARQIRDAYDETHGKGSSARIRVNERWLTDDQWHKIVEGNDKFRGKYAN